MVQSEHNDAFSDLLLTPSHFPVMYVGPSLNHFERENEKFKKRFKHGIGTSLNFDHWVDRPF